MIETMEEVGNFIYGSLMEYRKLGIDGFDCDTRTPIYARELLESLGNPDTNMDVVIVTGSKGKGSTARMLSSLLHTGGKRVGLFSSPHLVKLNERIRVDGKSISDEDFIRIANIVRPSVELLDRRKDAGTYIGPMGVLLAIAMVYFKEQGVDIAVTEVGIGGKYDEINVLDNRWAVITPILREHLDRIGPSLEDIVDNKIAIVKYKTEKVFIGKQTLESMSLIKTHLKLKTAIPYIYGKDMKADGVKISEFKTTFNLVSENRKYAGLTLHLNGSFQAENAATAVKVAEEILGKDLAVADVRECFKKLIWPGRCETLSYDPMVVLDGTIHRSSVLYLKEWLSKWEFENCSVVLSIPMDKDYKGVVEEIVPVADRIVTTKPDFSPKLYKSDVAEFARTLINEVHETESLEEALEIANESNPDLILILGTQHIVGTAKKLWGHDLSDIG